MTSRESSKIFPDPKFSDPNGLICAGLDLSPDILLEAYHNGIFPWYSQGDPILWWCPDPRFVLFPDRLKVSKSMEALIRSGKFSFSLNTDFEGVIRECSVVDRKGQDGTWIHPEMIEAYTTLHKMGFAICGEARLEGELVGGFYGVKLGKVLFGESMFSKVSNASKFAFISYVRKYRDELALIDCQVPTEHLRTLGAEFISLPEFLNFIKKHTGSQSG
jgi:leucyl/phenylalanyl-tRNA---protein transferase